MNEDIDRLIWYTKISAVLLYSAGIVSLLIVAFLPPMVVAVGFGLWVGIGLYAAAQWRRWLLEAVLQRQLADYAITQYDLLRRRQQ
jgi:hypothetical protein